GVGRDVAYDGRANPQIEQAAVTRDGENQHPYPEGRVPQTVKDERRKEYPNQYADAKAEPAGANVLDDLALAHGYAASASFAVSAGKMLKMMLRPCGSRSNSARHFRLARSYRLIRVGFSPMPSWSTFLTQRMFSWRLVLRMRVNATQTLFSSSGSSPRHQPSRAFWPSMSFRSTACSTCRVRRFAITTRPSTVVK